MPLDVDIVNNRSYVVTVNMEVGVMNSMITKTCGIAFGLAVAACSPARTMAMWTAPSKAPSAQKPDAKTANAKFWDTFHGGHYDAIPEALDGLTAAYLENPGDAETAAHIGWLHTWRATERARNEKVGPTITDDVVLAHKYFGEAVALNPDEPRYFGFLASMELAEGNIHKDEKLTRRGYFDLMDSIGAWPEFNLFTAGYVLSRLPYTDDKYKDGLDYQWETLDKCVGEKVDRR